MCAFTPPVKPPFIRYAKLPDEAVCILEKTTSKASYDKLCGAWVRYLLSGEQEDVPKGVAAQYVAILPILNRVRTGAKNRAGGDPEMLKTQPASENASKVEAKREQNAGKTHAKREQNPPQNSPQNLTENPPQNSPQNLTENSPQNLTEKAEGFRARTSRVPAVTPVLLDKQTPKQPAKQTDKQTPKQPANQTDKQPTKQTAKQPTKQPEFEYEYEYESEESKVRAIGTSVGEEASTMSISEADKMKATTLVNKLKVLNGMSREEAEQLVMNLVNSQGIDGAVTYVQRMLDRRKGTTDAA